ncbi:MAG: tyrosine-protein phosphatase [Dehalococcoidia bacterium]|nr:tyrosine-protein phosphatase [Dehalococcoidia bacterium]
MATAYERYFNFEQVFNFRDLGGYDTSDGREVRWRRVFRTAEHQRMKPEEVERLFTEVSLRTVIDFRSDGEASDERGYGALVREGVRRLHFPMGNANSKFEARAAGAWAPNYIESLERYPEHWTDAFRVLADEESYPTVFHCVTGKDRTGVFAALVLDSLGVDQETVLEDYYYSQQAMDTLVERLRARGIIKPDEQPNPALGVSREAMAEMMTHLHHRYQGARGFLRSHGVGAEVFEAVEAHLLEPR